MSLPAETVDPDNFGHRKTTRFRKTPISDCDIVKGTGLFYGPLTKLMRKSVD